MKSSAPIHFAKLDASLVTVGAWPKYKKDIPARKNHLVELIYDSHLLDTNITTPHVSISHEPEKNSQTKGWMIQACLSEYHDPKEVYQKEFYNKIQEIEAIGMKHAPELIENLGVSKDTPIQLGPCIYVSDNKRYPPSFRLFLEYERDEDGNPIYKQFRARKNNPLFIEFGTDKSANISPDNIKDAVKPGCKCQMVLQIQGWTFTLQKEDKSKGQEEAVIVRLKITPNVIAISPPEQVKEWDLDFAKLEEEALAQISKEEQAVAQIPKEEEHADSCTFKRANASNDDDVVQEEHLSDTKRVKFADDDTTTVPEQTSSSSEHESEEKSEQLGQVDVSDESTDDDQ